MMPSENGLRKETARRQGKYAETILRLVSPLELEQKRAV